MVLTTDLEKDLMEVLTTVGFDSAHAKYVIWAASEDDYGKQAEQWALNAISKAIIRVCNAEVDAVI